MKYLICTVPVMPLRAAPSDSSEMTSQLLFGEEVLLLERHQKNWVKIRNRFDDYEGWGALNQMTFIDKEVYENPTVSYTAALFNTVQINGQSMPLPLGCFLKGLQNGRMQWGAIRIPFKGHSLTPKTNSIITEDQIQSIALNYLNTPYLWGGRSSYGIDCSGFVQSVFRLLGEKLPRDARQQVTFGEKLEENMPCHCGDLAFFHNQEGRITHVGIMLDGEKIIHASGRVRIDKLDKTGIITAETGAYSHQLSVVRRIQSK